MANEDVVKFRGTTSEYKDTRGGASVIPSAVLGIVKNTSDATHSGKIDVYLKRMSGSDPNNPSSWVPVRYMSPFFGYTPNTGNPNGDGEYVGNPNSYGFWATPPDIGTEVICIFLNGDSNEGYYIGCVPRPGLTQMVPAIGAVDNIILNGGEASSYGGATKLPVGEMNNANPKQANALNQGEQPRPVHSYQAAIYHKQGLLRDTDRGPITSSSMRESPSRVFGISTPGRPIFQGGYDDATIKAAADNPNTSNENFKTIGRVGGHSFVMDDGDIAGKDQLIRLRTATGHTILMNDAAQTLFIIHANGQSYIELGKEGTIDMYSTNSVNIRTQGDLNLHADRNININAGEEFNINAKNVQIESEQQTNMFAGTNFAQNVKGAFTNKVDGAMSISSSGEASVASSSNAYINGAKVNLNTGSSGTVPQAVKQKSKIKHPDTFYSSKGFTAAPGKLSSITSRAPAHTPWMNANKGVDAKSNLSALANFPPDASSAVQAANAAAPVSPSVPVSLPVAATVPNTGISVAGSDKSVSNSLTSQMAVNAATGKTSEAVAQTAGTTTTNGTTTAVLGATALSPNQLAASGHIKPGMETAINNAVQEGKPLNEAIPPNAWTGKDGVNSLDDYLKNQKAQVSATQTLLDKSKDALVEKGVITGKESTTATGGLILATASKGVGPVLDYMKQVGATTASAATAALGPLSSKLPPGLLNAASNSVSDLIAGGKSSSGLADKAMSGLNTGSPTKSLNDTAKELFNKITEGFKAMTAGVPQNLTAINQKNALEQAALSAAPPGVSAAKAAAEAAASKATGGTTGSLNITGMLDKAFTKENLTLAAGAAGLGPLSSVAGSAGTSLYSLAKETGSNLGLKADPSGISNLPGGASSVTNIASNATSSIPGLSSIKDSVSKISSAASGALDSATSVVDGLKSKLGTDTNLASFASAGLNPNDLASLNGAINSVAVPGGAEIKLPTIAEGTNDVAELATQSKSLLGNPKIPPIKI